MTIAAIRNRYNLDPFLPVVIPGLFGAADDYESYEADSVWPLLMRGMFSVLYRDAVQAQKKQQGSHYNKSILPPTIAVPPKQWTRAFNIITVTLYDSDRILRPRPLKRTLPREEWEPPIRLAAAGKEKIRAYREHSEKLRTRKIIRRMATHCGEVLGKLPADYRSQIPGLNVE